MAGIGHNNPPPDPFEECKQRIDSLHDEAKQGLDGEEVTNQDLADYVGNLMTQAKAARKAADAERVKEKRPHDEAAKAVQEKWKPLLAQADGIAATCQAALAPWFERQEAERLEAERQAREEAERAKREAEEALRASTPDNLAEREAAEAKVEAAKKADAAARAAEKAKPAAGGTFGRKAHTRTIKELEITDERELLAYLWREHRGRLVELARTIAVEEMRQGKTSPGCVIREKKVVV